MPFDEQRQQRSGGSSKALIGAAVAAGAGAAAFFFARRTAEMRGDGQKISDAPEHTFRHPDPDTLVGRTVTINRSRQELYDAWRDFTRFPSFMENVERVERLDDKRSRWIIKAPAGQQVELVTKITEERPGEEIAWESEPESQIQTEGRVQFLDGAPGRGTVVRLTIRYDAPAGVIGRAIAKVMQREPNVQARRDLRRFKQLMETGEVTTNAGPSGRREAVTETKI